VAGNVEKREAPTLLWERLEIRLDETLDSLFAGINLDTNRRVAKFNLVASPVFSSNYGVGHWVWLSEINGGGFFWMPSSSEEHTFRGPAGPARRDPALPAAAS
jgi:hypothetical protein